MPDYDQLKADLKEKISLAEEYLKDASRWPMSTNATTVGRHQLATQLRGLASQVRTLAARMDQDR